MQRPCRHPTKLWQSCSRCWRPRRWPNMDWEKTARIVRDTAAGAALGAIACLGVYACLFVHTLTVTTAALPAAVDKAIAREANLTRAALSTQITPVVDKVDSQLTALQTNLFARVDKIEGDANTQLTDIRTAAVGQIADTRKELVSQLNNVTVPAGDVLGIIASFQAFGQIDLLT